MNRAEVEKTLLSRAARRMALVGMDVVTNDGTNADLDDPLGTALRKMGRTPSVPPTSADVSGVGEDDIDQLLDRAELRLCENILGNWDLANFSTGQRSEQVGSLVASVVANMERLKAKIEATYGGSSRLESGWLSLNFQTKGTDDRH